MDNVLKDHRDKPPRVGKEPTLGHPPPANSGPRAVPTFAKGGRMWATLQIWVTLQMWATLRMWATRGKAFSIDIPFYRTRRPLPGELLR
jgi:hypothetical protein